MPFYQWQDDDLLLFVRIQPKASKDELGEIVFNQTQADQLKVRITAPPVDGKANKHLLTFIGKTFGVAKSQVSLLSGKTGRNKKLLIKKPERIPDQISAPDQI